MSWKMEGMAQEVDPETDMVYIMLIIVGKVLKEGKSSLFETRTDKTTTLRRSSKPTGMEKKA